MWSLIYRTILLFIAASFFFGVMKWCGVSHKYIPDAFLSKEELLDDAIEINDFAAAHKIISGMGDSYFSDKPEFIEKTLRAEFVYLINHDEFLRAENIAGHYEKGLDLWSEILQSQKTNIYKKMNDFDDRTLSSICSYMDHYEFVSKYLQVATDSEKIISLLMSVPVDGSCQIGLSADKEVRKQNEEYAKNVGYYNKICDLVLSFALNTNNKKLAQQVLKAYKRSINVSIHDTHIFSSDEYAFEYDDNAREYAKSQYDLAFGKR